MTHLSSISAKTRETEPLRGCSRFLLWIAAGVLTLAHVAGAQIPSQTVYLSFDPASGDHVEVGNHAAHKPDSDSYTWEFWARVDEQASGWNLAFEFTGDGRHYVGYNAATNGWNFMATPGGVRTDTNADSYVSAAPGEWHFVQAVLDRENGLQILRVYDLIEESWREAQVTPDPGALSPSGTLYTPTPSFPYHGALQQVRFWRSARSTQDADNDMLVELEGDEPDLVAYWPMNDGEGDTALDLTANQHHGTLMGGPRWGGVWEDVFEPFEAPFALDFGEGAEQDDGERLLRNFPEKFVLQSDSLRYAPTRDTAPSSTALAVVENYLNRQNFVLNADVTLNAFSDVDETRVGLAVLAGPHSVEEPFDSAADTGFYGLVWAPRVLDDGAEVSRLEIREGFGGSLLAQEAWEGPSPFTGSGSPGEAAFFFEDFEDLSAVDTAWTSGGDNDLWEFGEPVGGPGSAYSGVNAAGTGLGADDQYGADTDAWLRSPVIDLTGAEGPLTLSFREYLDMDTEQDAEGFFHSATVTVFDAVSLDRIAELWHGAAQTEGWRFRQIQLPDEVAGEEIVLEFHFESDAFQAGEFDGWFLDDIAISGFEPMDYQMQAQAEYLRTGGVELSFTLTGEGGFSQTLSTVLESALTGNLFGFGGRLDASGWEFDLNGLSMELGTFSLPLTTGPASFAFGSAGGRAGAGNFFQNAPEDWVVEETSLLLAPAASGAYNSLAATQIGNFFAEPGETFFTRVTTTLANLDSDPSENRAGLVLMGHEDPEVFDADDDTTFYTFQWIPNSDAGSRILFREGMNGAVVAETDFEGHAGVGGTYTFEFFGAYDSSGALEFTARISDGEGAEATLSEVMSNPPTGNHFGFGVYHQNEGNPEWEFHRYDWLNFHPGTMPLSYAFGTEGDRDSDRDFFKTGERPEDWALGGTSLGLARGFRSGADNGGASATTNVVDYSPGQDFALRSTVTAAITGERPTFLRFDGTGDVVTVPTDEALRPMSDSYTWEFWVRPDPAATGWNLYVEHSGSDRFYVGINANSGWNFVLTSNGNRTDTNNPSLDGRWLPFLPGRWQFVQAVIDRDNSRQILRVYDPVAEHWEVAEVTPASGGTDPAAGDLTFSSNPFPGQGDLHEVRFWRQARTQADAEADMDQTLNGDESALEGYWPMDEGEGTEVVDRTANGNDGSFSSGQPEWVQLETMMEDTDISLDQFGAFPRFAGTEGSDDGDYAVVPENAALHPGADSYTWEFWARDDPGDTGWGMPFQYPGIEAGHYYVGYHFQDGWNFVVISQSGEEVVRTDTRHTAFIPRRPGRWVFVQAVIDRTNQEQILRLYDPIEEAWDEVVHEPAEGSINPSGNFYFGGAPDDDSPVQDFPFSGDLQEVRFWRQARTAADAEGQMFGPLEGSEAGLEGYWPMNEGSGSTFQDLSANANDATFSSEEGRRPEWVSPGNLQGHPISFALVAMAGDLQGTGSDLFSRGFRLEWFPGANRSGGELLLSSPESDDESVPSSATWFDASQASNAPVFEFGATYTLELGGFFRDDDGGLILVGSVSDENDGYVEFIHNIPDPFAFLQLDSWFGLGGRLPESATELDWATFEMGSPEQLGIDPPDFDDSTYAAWIEEYFTESERDDPEISGPDANPTGDGVANLIKFAFGMDPWSHATPSELPQMEITNGVLRLTYSERHEPRDVDYVPQMSVDLADWDDDGVTETGRTAHPDRDGFDRVTVEAEPPEEAAKGFLQILIRER